MEYKTIILVKDWSDDHFMVSHLETRAMLGSQELFDESELIKEFCAPINKLGRKKLNSKETFENLDRKFIDFLISKGFVLICPKTVTVSNILEKIKC